jgi:poly-gamma-glutamate capsule biosynthesis protein CapA/YwtB (metallophosphatase superfamily)
MRQVGVEVGSLANNHAYDRGPDGLLDSVKNLRDAGIAPIGAGKDEDAALQPAMFDLKGWHVAVLGFDEVLDPLDEVAGLDKPGTAAGHDFGLMLDAVKKASEDSDLVVVMIHWGVELDTRPRAYQVSEGHRLIDAGADMIFGSHSHRLQPFEIYRGKPIFYSLGNFVWPDFSSEGSSTGVAQVRVRPRGELRAKLLPATIVAPGHPELR